MRFAPTQIINPALIHELSRDGVYNLQRYHGVPCTETSFTLSGCILIIVHFSDSNAIISFIWRLIKPSVLLFLVFKYLMKTYFFRFRGNDKDGYSFPINEPLWRHSREVVMHEWMAVLRSDVIYYSPWYGGRVLSLKFILHYDGSEYSEETIKASFFNDMKKESVIGWSAPSRALISVSYRQTGRVQKHEGNRCSLNPQKRCGNLLGATQCASERITALFKAKGAQTKHWFNLTHSEWS